jgi:hypothetical protein
VLEPVYPFGGEWGGLLIFRLTARRVNYAITLHAWVPDARFAEPASIGCSRLSQDRRYHM